MARVFVYDAREFPDPDPNLTVEDVRRQLLDFFPELANAETREGGRCVASSQTPEVREVRARASR